MCSAQEVSDPFVREYKSSSDFEKCPAGHKKLHDVPIYFGRPNPELIKKKKAGEIVLRSATNADWQQKTAIVCKECGLIYNDYHDSWALVEEVTDLNELKPLLSHKFQGLPFANFQVQPGTIFYCSSVKPNGQLSSEGVVFWTTDSADSLRGAFAKWSGLKAVAIRPIDKGERANDEEWHWQFRGVIFRFCYSVEINGSAFVEIEWTNEKEVEQDEDDQATTAEESKP
jgi:hypothetical protein